MKKDIENYKLEKSNMLSDLQNEKQEKEKYKKDSDELKESQKKIKMLKNDIQKLSDENLAKEEKNIQNQNTISSLESKIKELEMQKEELNKKYNDLENMSNEQIQKIKSQENKDKNLQELINNLNLSNAYKNLAEMNKAELISMIMDKDKLYQKLEEEKKNLEKKISEMENKKNELEKNLSEFEAKNNTLNKKNEILNNEVDSLKKENEKLSKEKADLNNMVKEEKKLVEKMKNQNELLTKENAKIEVLSNENKKLKEDIINKDDIISKGNNKISLLQKTLDDKEEKIKNLEKENQTINNQYNELLNKYNDKLLNDKNKEKSKEDALKDIDEKYKYLKDMPIEELIKIIIDKDKANLIAQEENKNIQNKNKSLSDRNKKLEETLNKAKDLKQRYLNLRNTHQELLKNTEDIKKEKEELKQKYDKLLESVVKKDKEPKIFKTNLLAIIKTSQLILKKQEVKKPKKAVYQVSKIYDYLCLRLENKIIETLNDKHYDPINVFSESIKYIDEQNGTDDECILFITMEYFYLFNWKYKKCASLPLTSLKVISLSDVNNYMSFIFDRGEMIIIETFRILELINFFKILQARQKIYKYQFNRDPYIYSDRESPNYLECLYYGKAIFSGTLSKRTEGILGTKYEERFGVLCEIGLIILESPTGKPKNIINLLFAEISYFNNEKGNNCLAITVNRKSHLFSFENEKIRKEWEQQLKLWKINNSQLTKF